MASPNPDPHAGGRLRHIARLAKGERRLLSVVRDALTSLSGYALSALRESGMDPAVLETTVAPWRDQLTGKVTPAIAEVFAEAWDAVGRGVVDPAPYATRHIEAVWNRLSATSDDVFDSIRTVLAAGHAEGLSIPQLTAQIEEYLTDADTWDGRARTIARTEAIAANNAGAAGSARATADYLGVPAELVQQQWLATGDGRTRETHAEADGQMVTGLDTPFIVGGYELAYPGDPSGPPEETVNCRCTTLFEYPEAGAIAASANQEATMSTTTPRWSALTAAADDGDPLPVIVCALPSATDPVQSIGEEQKHATLCYLGPDDGTLDTAAVKDAIQTWLALAETAPHTPEAGIETVSGVESLGDSGARVWMIEPGGLLSTLRDGLMGLEPIGDLDREHNEHPDFTPHVTIDYPAESGDPADGQTDVADSDVITELDPETETAAAAVTRITFDRLAVWAGTEQTEYTLVPSDPTTEEPTVDEPTTASGTLLARRTGGDPAAAAAAEVDRLVAGGFGTREQITAALVRALHTPVTTPLAARRPVSAAAGDPAPSTEVQMDAGDPAPAVLEVPVDERPNADRFHGIATIEDQQTGDGRVFGIGSIYWDEDGLPMPLGWQVADAPGHDGSVICGRIDTFAREGNAITYTGTWDLDGAGWETRRMVDGQFLRGISVDTDDSEVVWVTPDGEPVDMFGPPSDQEVAVIQRSRLRSAALCRVPAFAPSGTEGAYIANGLPEDLQAAVDAELPPAEVPPDDVVQEALVASAVAADLPAAPSRPDPSWFQNPNLTEPTPMVVTADGRVYGHIAEWNTCHISPGNYGGKCMTAPHSFNDYAYFAVGTVLCADGSEVRVGQLTMDTGHAPLKDGRGRYVSGYVAAAHYDNTAAVAADIAVGEDEFGIWMAGKVRDDLPAHKIDALRAAGTVSGDWRPMSRNSRSADMVAALAVNVPGLPIPRTVAASAAETYAVVAAGVLSPEPKMAQGLLDQTLTMDEVRGMVASAVQQELAADRRRGRVTAAAERLRAHRVATAVARLERV